MDFSYPKSYQSLCDRLNLNQGLPYTKDWSAAADFLELIVDHALQEKPEVVVECSSGLTTLMLARCCQMNGQGHVYSLENGAEYAQATRDALAHYGLSETATVLNAPLIDIFLGEREFQWYSVEDLSADQIDMLVIDGPPGFIQIHSRYPALPVLMDKFADVCEVYLDDAGRDQERELVAQWLHDFSMLIHDFVETERGCSILRLEKHVEVGD